MKQVQHAINLHFKKIYKISKLGYMCPQQRKAARNKNNAGKQLEFGWSILFDISYCTA